MADTPISFTNPIEDDDFIDAFTRGTTERGGRRRAHVTTDPDTARLLPPYVTVAPRRGVQGGDSSRDDAGR